MSSIRKSWVAAVLGVAGIACGACAAVASAASPAITPGWGALPSFLGRYHLVGGTVAAPSASPSAGIFSLAVNGAARVAAVSQQPTGGELTIFMRKVKTGEPYVPSGILSVHTASGNSVIYLTMLSSAGSGRTAVVNQGAFVGNPIGKLTGTAGAGGRLTATVDAQGFPTFTVRLVRFSANPAP